MPWRGISRRGRALAVRTTFHPDRPLARATWRTIGSWWSALPRSLIVHRRFGRHPAGLRMCTDRRASLASSFRTRDRSPVFLNTTTTNIYPAGRLDADAELVVDALKENESQLITVYEDLEIVETIPASIARCNRCGRALTAEIVHVVDGLPYGPTCVEKIGGVA